MNKILIDALENELSGFLQKNPHLIDLQFKISINLAKLDNPEDRMYYMSMELLDSFYELKSELNNLHEKLERLK
jgi:hypothetical protein